MWWSDEASNFEGWILISETIFRWISPKVGEFTSSASHNTSQLKNAAGQMATAKPQLPGRLNEIKSDPADQEEWTSVALVQQDSDLDTSRVFFPGCQCGFSWSFHCRSGPSRRLVRPTGQETIWSQRLLSLRSLRILGNILEVKMWHTYTCNTRTYELGWYMVTYGDISQFQYEPGMIWEL